MQAVRRALQPVRAPIIWAHAAAWSLCRPLVACAGGTVLCLLFVVYGASLAFVAFGAVSMVLVLLACIDARSCLLPDALTQPLLWAGLATSLAGWPHGPASSLAGAMAGYAALAFLRYLGLWWRGAEAMGWGDVKLLAAMGAWIGPHAILHVLLLACLAAVLFAMLHQRRLMPRGFYPFGPFLAVAAMADFVGGSALQSWF